ncbi:TetR/AcrR family transcriptional regulator [Yoonia maritima]|uniref:TetR/AcrR family transcriptional regulator n=1 Tax=Yoonia maritima TaxID=1435347 RepID=UPI000D0F83ED|nr:TetR/AcrR family transcriptional regulator [Yoonia maritima]
MKNVKRPRGSKDVWLNAAYELLIEGGIDAVKVMPLAKRLNLSRTGFYWYFEDLAELHRAMIERWEEKNTGNLVARCNLAAANIGDALFNVMDCWLDPALFDAKLDLAIRNWARIDTGLKHRLSQADDLRIQALADMFIRFGYSSEQAQVRSLTVVYTQIGYISMHVEEDWNDRLKRVPHYVELFSGLSPLTADVEQFLNRHCFVNSQE